MHSELHRRAPRGLLSSRDAHFAGFRCVLVQRRTVAGGHSRGLSVAEARPQIYGAIAFYLDHQAAIDKHLEDTEREFEGKGIPMAEENPALWERLQRAKAKMGESRP